MCMCIDVVNCDTCDEHSFCMKNLVKAEICMKKINFSRAEQACQSRYVLVHFIQSSDGVVGRQTFEPEVGDP